ncbi:glutaredoxin-2, mitochondrial-like [Chrysoperla carnea]|uniref:glutaredoxin-2, mitochondrial-like n=1 Tax=Chrysoperla carnea TaxID=189513 RepID=UPI001D06A87F|nr:glutaredoxin-2, mitochondrial-like [Chrysoperla carnea]
MTMHESLRGIRTMTDIFTKYKVVLFSRRNCPKCQTTKEILDHLRLNYKIIDLDDYHKAIELKEVLQNVTGIRTDLLPQLFVDGKCVGSGTAIQEMYKKGILKKRVSCLF